MKQRKLATIAFAAAVFLAVPGWSQDPGEDPPDPRAGREAGPAAQDEAANAEGAPGQAEDAAATAEDGPAVVIDEDEESVLDDQTFEGDDDDFIPTEEIPVDEPIPFPTDI